MSGILETQIRSGEEIQELLKYYVGNSLFLNSPSKMECTYKGSKIWEIDLRYRHGIFVILNKESEFSQDVLDALSCCGAFDISVSIGVESRNMSDSDWKNWFLDKIASKIMVFDTNFVIRHYFSGIIVPHFGKEELTKMSLLMPRMVILEIERLGNAKQNENKRGKKSLSVSKSIEEKDKRLAFYATREIYDLRKMVTYDLIPMYDPSSIVEFANRTGKGFGDAWIRKEIHDMIGHRHKGIDAEKIVLITCDLMNSMAAEAEGLTSCYFSRLPKNEFNVNGYENQFCDFFVSNAVIFGGVNIDVLASNGETKDSFSVEGAWNGKTTSEWYSDSLRLKWRKISER